MNAALKILHLEDNESDAELVQETLRDAGMECEFKRVQDRAGFVAALAGQSWDMILADYSLPAFDGFSALKLLVKTRQKTPFIFVTGAMGEDMAVELLKRGATDYVLKNRLPRLPVAVQRALEDTAEQQKRRRAEEALEASERRYRRFVERNAAGVVRSTLEGTVLECNDAMARMLGYDSPDELQGYEAPRLFFERADREAMIERLKKQRSLSNQEFHLKRKDGRPVWALVNVSLVTNEGDDRVLLEGTVIDITGRKQNEEEIRERTRQLAALNEELTVEIAERKAAEDALAALQRETELILNSAGEAIFRIDLEGKCIFANAAAFRILGFDREELLGQNLHSICRHKRPDGSACPPEQCETWLALEGGTVQIAENQLFTRKDGTSIWVDSIASPMIQSGRIIGVVQVCRDVSERHAMEKMKDEFVSMVSHELRTPLTAIRGALWLLAADKSVDISPRIRHMLDIAVRHTVRLSRLLNNILDCARWEDLGAPIARTICDGAELAQQAADLMRPLAETVGVALETAVEPCPLRVEHDAILQSLSNLLSNAIKFSPAGAVVRLECHKAGAQAVFRIIDQGPGIPPDHLESIFGRFQQVDASDSRRKGGTGLGLYLCRTMVERHGGRIWVESKVGEGSTFVVTLPIEHLTASG